MPASKFGELSKYIDLLLDAVCVVDIDGNFVHISAGCERIFGYTQQEMIGRNMLALIHPDDKEKTVAAARDVASGKLLPHFENRYIRKDGTTVHIMWSARWSEDDKLRIAVARDITARKLAEARQAAVYAISEATHAADELPTLFAGIHDIVSKLISSEQFCIALIDDDTDAISLAYHAVDPQQPASQSMSEALELCTQVIRAERAVLTNATNQTRHSDTTTAQILCVPLRAQKHVVGALLMASRCSDQAYTEADKELLQFVSTQIGAAIRRQTLHSRLQQLALHDELTGLPNRSLFHDRLKAWLARVRREQAAFSLLYVDLDRFKEVNDQHGHGVGDTLLQQVAKRLQACIRDSDTVARFGGDEFVVLLANVKAPEQASIVAEKILDVLNQPFILAGTPVTVVPSIGIAHCPLHGTDVESLLRKADRAMYQAKSLGGNQYHVDRTEPSVI